jgi:hypothetical protein
MPSEELLKEWHERAKSSDPSAGLFAIAVAVAELGDLITSDRIAGALEDIASTLNSVVGETDQGSRHFLRTLDIGRE